MYRSYSPAGLYSDIKDFFRLARRHASVLDGYGPEERALIWYCYPKDRLRFPFQATCVVPKVGSQLRKGETVEVLGMAPEEACSSDMVVLIRWQGRNIVVPLSELAAIDAGESTTEAISYWHYWVAQGCCFRTRRPGSEVPCVGQHPRGGAQVCVGARTEREGYARKIASVAGRSNAHLPLQSRRRVRCQYF